MDVKTGSNADNVYLYDCHGRSNQQFQRGEIDSDGYYTIIAQHNGKCIDAIYNENDRTPGNANDGTLNNGDNIRVSECGSHNKQKWKVDGDIIRNKAYDQNYCIGGNGDNAYIWSCSQSGTNQRLVFVEEFTTTIVLKSDTSNWLDVKTFSNGDNVHLYNCHGRANQRFKRGLMDSDGYYQLIAQHNGKCIEANPNDNDRRSGNANDNPVNSGDNIHVNDCDSDNNQKWKFDGNNIRNKANGQIFCLGVGYYK